MRIRDIVENLGISIYRENKNVGELYCYCPFHEDSSPSLNINTVTGKFQCWAGCVKGNSINELSKLMNGSTCAYTEEDQLANFRRKLYKTTNNYKKEASIPVLPLAIGNKGQEYLESRGISIKSIEKWGLKYWENERSIVIPAENIGYVLRFIDMTDRKSKYKYIAGTKIADCLFGESRLSYDKFKYTILVEGSLDVIALHQKGYNNALGLLHSNLSESQFNILRRHQYPVYIMLDPDIAGQSASSKIKQRLRNEFIVKICSLPDEKDPDQCTVEELEQSIASARR